jgi:RNA polymerase sigma-70 factor (ECF subfamily)
MEESFTAADVAKYRNYLLLIARSLVGNELRGRGAVSDVVQDTLLKAVENFSSFRGKCAGELLAWLRQILASKVADHYRSNRRQKRDVRLERSIQAAIDKSSSQLACFLADSRPSPSEELLMAEKLARVADAVAALPEGQRDAVTLHHLCAYKISDAARELGKTVPATAGLIQRGLQSLRASLKAERDR